MSEDHGDELNFNELVGNLLSSHNATESHDGEGVDAGTHFNGEDGLVVDGDGVPEHLEAELPEFGDGEEDDALAAVVASAIQSMDHEEQPENEEEDALPRDDSSGIEQENDDHQQDRHWANVLQQSLLQGNEPGKAQNEEQLDQDDETLRRAILESLSELNTAERHSKQAVDDKEKPKKGSKKKKKKKEKEQAKEKHTSAKKKKHRKKGKDTSSQTEDLLDFDDVIRGFMRQGNEASEEAEPQAEVAGDEETQALVEATLRAFERELLGSQSGIQAPNTNVKSKEPVVKDTPAQQNLVSKGDDLEAGITSSLIDEESSKKEVPSTASKKKKKKKKKRKQPKDSEEDKKESDEDEFSKALAAMVNEVVNTSLTDSATVAPESPQTRASPAVETPTVDQEVEDEHEQVEEETFDLNQIMQKAMSMAFQEQTQDSFDSSAMEEFNRGLGDLSVSDIISGGSTALKKKSTSKASRTQMTPRVPKTARKKASSGTGIEEEPLKKKSSAKPPPSPEEILRKKYCQAAMAAAATARKRAVARNKTMRLHLRAKRKKAREEKKLQKKQAKEQLEIERKELEEIVAKGPPYPPDLRLTKSGKPKKPYRRWTQEELEKRASMPPEDLEKPKKVKKTKKKKTKKLKKVPLSNLKKIPLFNFGRDSIPVEVKHKLNGIDETLEKIPLQSHQPDISKLAPPDTVPPESWQNQQIIHEGDESFDKARYPPPFAFDAGRKTVVRREKIPFHPPWALPSQIPYALPLARRKRKEKPKESSSTAGGRQRVSKIRRSSISSSVRNRIIPAVLIPIIGTLKAAAKAKVASGASPEEANRHLLTIIRHTKRSIAESLSLARRHPTRNYSAIKSEHDLHSPSEMRSRKAARIPIFSLSRIKQIDTSEDNVVKPTGSLKSVPHVSEVKIEDEESPQIANPAIETVEETSQNGALDKDPQEPISVSETPMANGLPGDPSTILNKGTEKELSEQELIRSDQNVELPISTNEGERTFKVPERETVEVEEEQSGEGLKVSSIVRRTEQDSTGGAASPVLQTNGSLAPTENLPAHQTAGETSPHSPNLGQKRSRNDEQLAALRTVISEGANVTKSSLESLKDTIDKSSVKEEQMIHDVLDDLVKEHFTQSNINSVDLPFNVRNIISETIEELIPVIDVQQRDREEKPKRQRKGPPPVLNLDGLVPPNNLSVIPKIESSPSPSVSQKLAPKVRKPRKKPDQPVLLYTFNVPDLKSTQGKRTMLLKRAKEYLSPEEMTILKKEINKERKRKWREANVEKNWENDLRARLKKRANAKFGDQDTLEKSKWYQDELNKGLSEREVKQEEHNNVGSNASNKRSNGSTNLSDNEVLNMIASTLNKLEVARLLERELNEDAAGYQDEAQNKKSKSTPLEEVCEEHEALQKINQPALQASIPSYDEQVSYDGQGPHNDNGEILDESGNTKRPYPDDIPVTVSLVKRPKSVSAQEDK